MTISTSTRKLITSLKQAKHRKDQGLFVVEGTRAVLDTVPFFDVEYLVATSRWIEEYGMGLPGGLPAAMLSRTDDMERMSSLTTPQGVLAVCRMPHHDSFAPVSADELVIALDKVQDPGNLGTIMRVADWFGVTRILASECLQSEGSAGYYGGDSPCRGVLLRFAGCPDGGKKGRGCRLRHISRW